MANEFEIKDSGERLTFPTGMQRDSGKKTLRPDLIWLPGLIRLAEHYGKGALKYSERNWEKASTQEELDRFKASAFRHFVQWMNGERDEDHMSAIVFNLFGAEFVRAKLIFNHDFNDPEAAA
jgi:hypothetical protein